MFRRISQGFNDLPVGRKLAIGFGVLVFLTLLMGATAIVGGQVSNNAQDALQLSVSDQQNVLKLNQYALEARRHEKDFFLRYRSEGYDTAFQSYAVPNQQAVQDFTTLANTMIAEHQNHPDADSAVFTKINADMKQYGDGINQTFTDLKERGSAVASEGGTSKATHDSLTELAALAHRLGDTEVESRTYYAMDGISRYNLANAAGSNVTDAAEKFGNAAQDEALKRLQSVKDAILNTSLDSSSQAQMLAQYNLVATNFDSLAALDDKIVTEANTARTGIDGILALVDQETASFTKDAAAAQATLDATNTTVNVVSIFLLILSTLVAVAFASIVSRSLTGQVAEIQKLFKAAAIGEFGARAAVLSRDELGRAAEGVNAMLGQLTGILDQTEAERARLEAAISKLVSDVGELATGDLSINAEVGQGSTAAIATALNYAVGELRGLVSGVESTATQVTEASTSMSEIVKLLVEQAASSAQVAEQASASAQQGDRVVSETIAAMTRIRENTQETARRMKRLGETSQEISEVVRLIEELSDRTTVLALNASIQAASAGEAGRGFAVVAEEVQRLAERATGATRQIEELVKGIQAEANEAAVGIEEATREVVEGSRLAQNAGEKMSELNRRVTDLSALIQHVAQTTAQQTEGSLVTLSDLSQGLLTSVSAFKSTGAGNGNGNGREERFAAQASARR